MKLLFAVVSLLIPLIGITIVYIRPSLKDQSLELILFLRQTIYNGLKRDSSSAIMSSSTVNGKGCLGPNERLFTPKQLSQFDGNPDSEAIYLAFLGVVYDVTQGARHYAPGGAYAFFAGKDATRAFVTGQFDEDGLSDDVSGLSVDSFSSVRQWEEFYEKDYPRVGRLIGTYYDEEGCATAKVDYVKQMYAKYQEEEAKANEDTEQFPHCNSEFHADTNYHRVWCSDMSGGTKRNWIGVPRQLYLPKEKTFRCACVRNTGQPSTPAIEYVDEEEEEDDNGQAEVVGNSSLDEEKVKNDDKISDDKVEEKKKEASTAHDGGDIGDLRHPRIKEYPGCDPKSTECVISSPLT